MEQRWSFLCEYALRHGALEERATVRNATLSCVDGVIQLSEGKGGGASSPRTLFALKRGTCVHEVAAPPCAFVIKNELQRNPSEYAAEVRAEDEASVVAQQQRTDNAHVAESANAALAEQAGSAGEKEAEEEDLDGPVQREHVDKQLSLFILFQVEDPGK